MTDLSRIGEREKLKTRPGDEPHWHRLRQGCYVGYRPSKKGKRGTWFARVYDRTTRKNRRKPLGDYGTLSGHDVFSQAKTDAEDWAKTVESGGVHLRSIVTVEDACRAYLEDRPRPIEEGVFRRHVFSDPIAKIELAKLRRHQLQSWRNRLKNEPALVSRRKNGDRVTKPRAQSTINRDMVPLRAALRKVIEPGAPNTDAAWQEALKPIKGADRRRTLYLDKAERMRLIEATSKEAIPFVRGLCMLPLRAGALAALRVEDFDERTRSLTVGRDKSGAQRQISLPSVLAIFLAEEAATKLPKAPIFARPNGKAWDKDAWKYPIKAAAARANLPSGVVANTLRHSVLTDLVRAGIPILTVAQMSGTGVAMIEKHYGHLVREDAEEALASLAF